MNQPTSTGQLAETNAIAEKLSGLKDELRATIARVEDVQAKAMLETGAEVLGGLRRAFVDYAEGTEAAWRR